MHLTPETGTQEATGEAGRTRIRALVRFSGRARRMRLLAHPGRGLELVAPSGTSVKKMQAFLDENAAWALRGLRRIDAPLEAVENLEPDIPETVSLTALNEDWHLVFRENEDIGKGTFRLSMSQEVAGNAIIQIEHAGDGFPDKLTVAGLLRRALQMRGGAVLPGMVDLLARETGLQKPARVRIGVQQTVWGSLSSSGTMSLSAKLLLLTPELVRHVILHELCHIGMTHHRASFYRRLQHYDPDAHRNHRALKEAASRLPAWSNAPRKS